MMERFKNLLLVVEATLTFKSSPGAIEKLKCCVGTHNEYGAMDEEQREEFTEAHSIDPRIIKHYLNTIACTDSWGVIEVMIEWAKDFPIPPDADNMLQQMGMGDLLEGTDMQENSGSLTIALENSEDIESCESSGLGGESEPNDDHGEKVDEFSSADYYREDYECDINTEMVARLQPRLKMIFSEKSRYVATKERTNRLYIKNIVRDREEIYKKQETATVARKKFNILVDCSGSMHGRHIEGAASIVSLFSGLAEEGLLEGMVVLSSSYGYQTFRLPISNSTISSHFNVGGGEGFANTFEKVEDVLRAGDINFVITDGNITDGALDKQGMTQKGIKTFGLYIGDPERCNLDRWFHRGVAREKLSELVDELVGSILAKPL
jgi:hypothetical protein